MWTSAFFRGLASTCVAPNPVCRTRFLLSRQRGQIPEMALLCGQPGSCASNSPKVMHKDRQISGEVTAQAGFSPGRAAPCTPSGSPAAGDGLSHPARLPVQPGVPPQASLALAAAPGLPLQRRGLLRPVKGTGSSFFPAGCQCVALWVEQAPGRSTGPASGFACYSLIAL